MAKAKRDKSNYVIQAVAHAFDVLEVFQSEGTEFGVTELSRKLELHKNNVFRILATLEARGYIEQNKATEQYRLGVKSLELGQAFVRQTGLLRQARPVIEELVQELAETVYVSVLRGGRVVHIDSVEPERTVRVVSQLGMQMPAHASAAGKVLLAFGTGDAVERLLAAPLEACTERTLTDRAKLAAELEKVRKQGFAVELGELEDGLNAIAAPVRDYASQVVGAIAVAAPASRLAVESIPKGLGPRIAKAGLAVSNRLGFGLHQAANA